MRVAVIAALMLAASAGASPPELPESGPARETLDRLLEAPSWARRAIAAVRLERYGCPASEHLLIALLDDRSWQVRAFAVRTLGRRGRAGEPSWLADEPEPRVVRAALRRRYPIDVERLTRGIDLLLERSGLEDRMLGVELAAASGDAELVERARDELRSIIRRMDRRAAGALAPRLAALTGQHDLRRPSQWQRWMRTAGHPLPLAPTSAADEDVPPSLIAALDEEAFFNLEDYLSSLSDRDVDLVICLDTTASMWGELAEVQGELDDMMRFASDVVRTLRVGIVAYRDRRDRYDTVVWDLTSDVTRAREQLWSLSADGGGDTPELVDRGLHRGYASMSWAPGSIKALVLVGDAPPHPGYGHRCVELAALARGHLDLVTHTVQADGRSVDHFAAIANAGGGRCVNLTDNDSLVVEIAGLTLGDRFGPEFREFFATYLDLCR